MSAALSHGLLSARSATLGLLQGLDDAALRTQFDPDFSPIAWHFGHVAWQEEGWLLRRLGGRSPLRPELDGVLDSFVSEKGTRAGQLPPFRDLVEYAERVRAGALAVLGQLEPRDDDPLLRQGHVAHFLANHERQHAEVIATVRLLGGLFVSGAEPTAAAAVPSAFDYVTFEPLRFTLGDGADPDGWDNERHGHVVDVAAFALRRGVVTNGEWLEMMQADGYQDERLWDDEGRRWLRESGAKSPLHWRQSSNGWIERTLAGERPLRLDAPVAHVCFHEAQAFARFAGARLPSEAEWERAASWDQERRAKRRYPWGDDAPAAGAACLACAWSAAAPAGAFPEAVSRDGLFDLCGGVWEWTRDTFRPYPGFSPQPYQGYSQPWFDDRHRVARGGSYMTRARERARRVPQLVRTPHPAARAGRAFGKGRVTCCAYTSWMVPTSCFAPYFGAPSSVDENGREVGATRALLRSLNAFMRDANVTHVACAFDHVVESFRNDLFAGYKTGEGIAPDLLEQFPLAERAARALGMVVWPMVEFEADDALATGAARLWRGRTRGAGGAVLPRQGSGPVRDG